jgi:tol-pal system protein YbgF
MKRLIGLIVVLTATVLVLSGCVVATQSSKNRDQTIADLQAKVAQLEQQQQQLEQRYDGTAQKSAEAYLASEQIQQEISVLRGRFDESAYQAEKYKKEVGGLRDFMGSQMATVDERLSTVEKKVGIKSAKGLKPLPAAGTAAALVATNDKKGADDLYKEAYKAFKANNIEVAKAKFRQFLKLYPDHKYSDDSQFNLAECFFKQEDFENAILEYDKVTAKYPTSKLTRSAFLNLGFAFLELGSKSDARLFFEKVAADYPGTEESKIAKKKLQLLK